MSLTNVRFENPFRPGAGHMPPHLAGRTHETSEFKRLLAQDVILENVVLTGLRGVGKTVLLETLKPIAIEDGWLWVGTDLSEAASASEGTLSVRMLTDLSVVTSSLSRAVPRSAIGCREAGNESVPLDFTALSEAFNRAPGLAEDKVKAVLEEIASVIETTEHRGIIFAYDEAQNLADRAEKDQYPLSLLLDVFQSIQRKGIPFMLLLTGLPTLFPKLVDARTFAERMFRVMTLDKLTRDESHEAITRPIDDVRCPVTFSGASIDTIITESGGYPYFIQFICREVYDVFIQLTNQGAQLDEMTVPVDAIVRKLDSDFFSGRWAKPTDRQRELLKVIALLEHPDAGFTVQEVVAKSHEVLTKGFSASHVNQLLVSLSEMGLVYKNRHGKYSFALPLFAQFILRQIKWDQEPQVSLF
jgi:AAA ATPase-like protein